MKNSSSWKSRQFFYIKIIFDRKNSRNFTSRRLKKATSKGRECSIYPLENNKRKRKCYLEREKYSKKG